MAARTAHTFLFAPGHWTAKGQFWDAEGAVVEAEGETTVTHAADRWTIAGSLRLMTPAPTELSNTYDVTPGPADGNCLSWESENPSLGKLHGWFVPIGAVLVSRFQGEKPGIEGVETLIRQAPDRYAARGCLVIDGRLVSRWDMRLRRQ